MDTSRFQNIIFDLGGVILNLSVPSTIDAFARHSGKPAHEIASLVSSEAFLNYEKGLISDDEFRAVIRAEIGRELSDSVIDQSWNAMLLDLPKERLDLLTRLKKTHRTFLLSNTNEIHLKSFLSTLKDVSGHDQFDPFFEKAYYSHRMKMRKPDAEIFDFVLRENNLDPSATLFLDDNLSNLEGASKVGIQTFHVQKPELIFTLFS